MHYYKFNIPDWTLHTAHLSPEEEGVYLRLVNYYYDTEEPFSEEKTQSVIRRLRLGSHMDIVAVILDEFFYLTDGHWHHKRCDFEVKAYHDKAEKNRANGRNGGRPKGSRNKQKPKKTQVVNSGNPNKTLTNNHKPLTNNHSNNGQTEFDHFWNAYPRKTKKQDAARAFKKLKPDHALLTRILTHIADRQRLGDWEQKEYIPHPTTFLNGKRWEDEIIPRGAAAPKAQGGGIIGGADALIAQLNAEDANGRSAAG